MKARELLSLTSYSCTGFILLVIVVYHFSESQILSSLDVKNDKIYQRHACESEAETFNHQQQQELKRNNRRSRNSENNRGAVCLNNNPFRIIQKCNHSHRKSENVQNKPKPSEVNFKPIIGVLVQAALGPNSQFGEFIIFPAHVKWLEMSGAKVVPIWGNQTVQYYQHVIEQINGVYLPGGHSNPLHSTYGRDAKVLLDLAIQENDKGVYLPVWATCLGLQFLLSNAAGEIATYKCEEMFKQTKFFKGKDYDDSFIQKNVPFNLLPVLFDENNLPHMHHNCVSMKTYHSNTAMRQFFKVVSVNTDDEGTEYISTMEARNYPIYSVQWHPEKFSFHWNMKANTPHTSRAIEFGQTLGRFFISEARRNSHEYKNAADEEAMLIDNFQVTFMGQPSYSSFYFFTARQMTNESLNERKFNISEQYKEVGSELKLIGKKKAASLATTWFGISTKNTAHN
ncbi:gamma-glutamyl hydrolase-like [Tubulanus polymorphus]|uniref:gamma-glutamyl hydrolase-like n=1 Tax=Tubulanus polymorphus TaxID=672921 RepID=UPI003DA4AD4F